MKVPQVFRIAVMMCLLQPGMLFCGEPVSFSREVLPILSDNCLSCHGPDEGNRKADLRLDTREGALAVMKPNGGAFLDRIISEDPEEVMPPPKSHKPRLNEEQVALLKRWISEGVVWGKHWAFEKPVKLPVKGHPVDFWVRQRLAKEGLDLAQNAPEHTLRRRLSFDLTGLPPITEDKPDERLVDRLLASAHFGERMAMWWLDAARYSDTDGFQSDATRTNWPWRDYVVESFNDNKPFDQFTLEQFAGDLMPNATPDQVVATCFHRNHMTNGEGGRDPEESRVDYVIDRVNTVGTVWMGLTMGCAQCHTHKFDPIQHSDYYRLSAFFNSIDEDGKAGAGAKPFLAYQSPHAQRSLAEAKQMVEQRRPLEVAARQAAQGPFDEWLRMMGEQVRQGYLAWQLVTPAEMRSAKGTTLEVLADGSVQASGANPRQDDYTLAASVNLPRITGLRLELLPSEGATGGGLSRGKTGEFILTDIKVQVRSRSSSQVRDIQVAEAVADLEKAQKESARAYGSIKGVLDDDPRNGWTLEAKDSKEKRVAVFALAEPLVLAADEELVFELQHRSTVGDANIGRYRLLATDQAGPAVRSVGLTPLEELAAAKGKADSKLRSRLFEQFLTDHLPYQAALASLKRAEAQLAEVSKAADKLNVMVLKEMQQPRETHVLVRGVWDKKGAKVTPGVPEAVAPWPEGVVRDRLGLAKWLVARDHPLTARVLVNQLWQLLFGAGLVRTPDDFGLQGERPVHPELLDWLAVDLMENGWDIKRLLRLIVTSETYRQDSALRPGLDDPANRLLARGPRFRLPAWMIRDAALQSAGLLNSALGGPPVRPYQPEGVWEEIFMGRYTYVPSEGAAQYRRTLYAFWRRSSAPTFLFDSAQRRVCEVAMTRTNTPLQALTLLNDQSLKEAAEALAMTLSQKPGNLATRLNALTKRLLSRSATAAEVAVLEREFQRALRHYESHPADAAAYYTSAPATAAKRAELCAFTLVSSLILNLDEAITHE